MLNIKVTILLACCCMVIYECIAQTTPLATTNRAIDGKKHGRFCTYYNNNAIKKEAYYFNDTLDGPEYVWDSLGKLRFEYQYVMGKLKTLKEYYKGSLTKYTEFNSDTTKTCTRWYLSKKREEYTTKGDWRIGWFRAYHDNGNIWCEGFYPKEGRLEKLEMVYRSEMVGSIGVAYRDQIEDGEWKYWYPNGNLQRIEHYNLGAKDGQWEYFDSLGISTRIEIWENDSLR